MPQEQELFNNTLEQLRGMTPSEQVVYLAAVITKNNIAVSEANENILEVRRYAQESANEITKIKTVAGVISAVVGLITSAVATLFGGFWTRS